MPPVEQKTKQHDFNIFRKLRKGATTIVSWEILPKKKGACPLQKLDIDYKVY